SPFPSNSAHATRVYFICRIYKMLGCDITVVSTGNKNSDTNWADLNGFNIIHFAEPIKGKVQNVKNLILGRRRLSQTLSKVPTPDVVIVTGGYSRYISTVKKYCKRNSSKLVVEVCEWFNESQFPLGKLGPFY